MGQSAYAEKPITQNVASNTKNKNKEQNKMTYFFNIANYGMAGQLFKIVNIDLTKEIRKIKENPKSIRVRV